MGVNRKVSESTNKIGVYQLFLISLRDLIQIENCTNLVQTISYYRFDFILRSANCVHNLCQTEN